ncbi:MAG: DUF1523 family protein [Bdellovibrio sp.]|nr:DUF1523 family protein [Bdellovibrio sp.]
MLIVSLFFYYYLPKTKDVFVAGTEVKRTTSNNRSANKALKDVRHVVDRAVGGGETLVFRNEDIPWPPHFKFNSGDLAG